MPIALVLGNAMQPRGFSLLEVLVATTLVGGALAALAQLIVFSTDAAAGAKRTTIAAVLATQKMEQLRSSDLGSTPVDALERDVDGACDFFDGTGLPLAAGSTTPPAGTVYVRRWSIQPLPTDSGNSRVVQVVVFRPPTRVRRPWPSVRQPDEARLITVATRKAR